MGKEKKSSEIVKDNKSIEIAMVPILTECPFREFKDNELGSEYWGLSPAALRWAMLSKGVSKVAASESGHRISTEWVDEQTQPLPRSARYSFSHWVRAEQVASEKWEVDIEIAEENASKMSVHAYQITYKDIFRKSSFCRKVLTACYILERVDNLVMEHTWEGFSCVLPPEGWRAKNLIYSPGMKPGGGAQHKPSLKKNGCYLVRLYYVGAWRCVWVSDQVPVDASGEPLLPFRPLLRYGHGIGSRKLILEMADTVYLWPLLLCKALLKLAAPNMSLDEMDGLYDMEPNEVEDEEMKSFDIFHALTGIMNVWVREKDPEKVWEMVSAEVPSFTWDDDDITIITAVKSKSSKKTSVKDDSSVKKALVFLNIGDTKECLPWELPGITPAYPQELIVNQVRDVPVKRPLPEPDVPLWKTYRWVDWARRHGLYDDYDFPRTRYFKVNGFMKVSYAPHLLEVTSADSLTVAFRKEHERPIKPKSKDIHIPSVSVQMQTERQDIRDWIRLDLMVKFLEYFRIGYSPLLYQFTTSTNNPHPRSTTKGPLKGVDVPAPKSGPLYLQVDLSEINNLRISLSTVHPRVMTNCGVGTLDYVEPAYVILEVFQWFVEQELSKPYAYIETRGYNTVSAVLPIGRNFCRIWIHSRLNYHLAILSESNLILGSKDTIFAAATKECPWAVKFFDTVKSAFNVWIRAPRTKARINQIDSDFFASYEPDLEWDPEIVGYNRSFRHWMFRKALQATLRSRLPETMYETACHQLRFLFLDPDFGVPPKPSPRKIIKENIRIDTGKCMAELQKMEGLILREATKQRLDQLSSANMQNTLSTDDREKELEELYLQILNEERERIYKEHQAATLIQSHWRGVWSRRYMNLHFQASAEVIKTLTDNVFGTVEGMSALMNQFFLLYPGATSAYSVSSALGGIYGLQQHSGVIPITSRCTWIPLFQGNFTCHSPLKAHFDITSSLPFSTIAIYDNDTEKQLEQAYNADLVFNFTPNEKGYRVQGHGTLLKPMYHVKEVNWQLTILSSVKDAFHICDEQEICSELPMPVSDKFRFEEPYMPNRRNILGALWISAHRNEVISFKATTTYSELKLEAYLKKPNHLGDFETIATCTGKGSISWPYIKLKCNFIKMDKPSTTAVTLPQLQTLKASKSIKLNNRERSTIVKMKSAKSRPTSLEGTDYIIEVIAPKGWPLSIDQWNKVEEVRNEQELPSAHASTHGTSIATGKGKSIKMSAHRASAVDGYTATSSYTSDDAYTIFECAYPTGGGIVVRRDESREQKFLTEKLSWGTQDSKRNQIGEELRQAFRQEFLAPLTPIPSELEMETVQNEMTSVESPAAPRTPTTMSVRSTEKDTKEELYDKKFLHLPDIYKDKFIPLPFVDECTKEKIDSKPIIITPAIAQAASLEREARMCAAKQRSKVLQNVNDNKVMKSQAKRTALLKSVFTDADFSPNVIIAMEDRDHTIAREIKDRQESATRRRAMEAAKKNVEVGKKGGK